METNSLDSVDIAILMPLQRNGELTNKEIAVKIYKSVATIHERVRRLKEQGYIVKTVTILDLRKINKSSIAYSHVLLNDHAADTLDTFEQEVVKFHKSWNVTK
ncbi:Lrp/AsnC family transcriptional regulator [Mucilaginibacter jinjuensis]|uniref:Lrp/AsnC family transcriptional regulator n=1 Tax=Mucilaginibacter jinjuensis TaxID=1176721 RepID=UPI0030805C9D